MYFYCCKVLHYKKGLVKSTWKRICMTLRCAHTIKNLGPELLLAKHNYNLFYTCCLFFNIGIYPFILVQEFICMWLERMVLLLEKSFALLFDWINPIDCQTENKSKNKVQQQRQQDTLLGHKNHENKWTRDATFMFLIDWIGFLEFRT